MAAQKLLTLDEAVKLLNHVHQIDPVTHGKDAYSKKTLYNKIAKGELKRFGPRHICQLDETELIKKLGR